MTGDKSGVAFVERLTPLLATGDLVEAYELLLGLDGEELAQAKKWFASSARWCRDISVNIEFAGADHDEQSANRHEACWILAMCAVVLCGPRTAAERVTWSSFWDFMKYEGEATFVHLLWEQPPEWVAQFVDASAGARLGGRARNVNGNLSRVLRAAVVHHGLPCPTGATFLNEWLSGTPLVGRYQRPEMTLAQWLAIDPLMPDVLHLFLANGDCGAWPGLPDAIGELVRNGTIDRGAVLDTVLGQLTTSQRPKSQRVLVAILDAMGVRAHEVPGGLDYLLGVLASGDRGVQPVLLPWALELADGAEDWKALADLVVGRPDKKAKELVLAALKQPGRTRTAGPDAVGAALDVLGAVDDVAFAAKVQAVRSALGLGLEAPEPAEPAGPMGLWDLPPLPSEVDARPTWLFSHRSPPGWLDLLGPTFSYRDQARPWMVQDLLTAMAAGTYDGSPIVAATRELLGQQQFLSSSAAKTFEDLFVAGGLRQGWPTAVEVADLAAGAPVRPAGLAGLVRMLVRYAPEVPPGASPLPGSLVALAEETSRTKSAMEARALVDALGQSGIVEAGVGPVEVVPARSGLWDKEAAPPPALPSSVSLVDDPIPARAATLTGLRDLLSENFNGWAQSFGDVCWWPMHYEPGRSLTALTEPDRVLAATVRAVHRDGAEVVRATLRGIERQYRPVDVVAAVDVWVDGALDAGIFWRLARDQVVSVHDMWEWWRAEGHEPGDVRARVDALPSFADRLRAPIDPEHGALVVPTELHSPLERFTFLRATEALLRAESEPVLLSLPTWSDGTLDAQDLLVRLDAVAQGSGVVGPLDLVQALHRLRKVDVRLVDRVPGGLRTDPRFTDPDGVEGLDATDMVRTWFASGGLPELEPRADEGAWTGPPASPVPFGQLAAWPAELAADPWCPGPMSATLRLYPGWSDRVFDRAFEAWSLWDPRHLPSLAADPLGVPFHDRLLALLAPEHNQKNFECLSTLVLLARAGRLDPVAAAAAARGRHEAGVLGLSVLVKALQRGIDETLRGVWPMAIAIADALCTVEKRPAQLAELLRVLTTYAHEVPPEAAHPPPGLVGLAEAKGSTKAHAAARDLVAALRQAVAS